MARVRTLLATITEIRRAGPVLTLVILALALGGGLLPPLTVAALAKAAEALARGDSLVLVLAATGFWALLSALPAALQAVSLIFQSAASEKLFAALSLRLMAVMARPSPLDAFNHAHMHDDVELLRTGIATRPVNVVVTLAGIAGDAVALMGLLVLLGSISPFLPLLSGLLGFLSFRLASESQTRLWEGSLRRNRASRVMSYLFSLVVDRAALPELRLYSGFSPLMARFRAEAADASASMNAGRRKVALNTALTLLAMGGLTALMALDMARVGANGGLDLGRAVLMLGALASLESIIGNLADQLGWVGGQMMFFEKYFSFLAARSAESPSGDEDPAPPVEVLALEKAGFTYPDGPAAVAGATLMARPGEVIAIVGRNGSGKTTLLRLLAGLYTPQTGSLMVNDQPMTARRLSSYWRRTAFLAQDTPRLKLTAELAVSLAHPAPPQLADRLRDIDPALRPETPLGVELGGADLSGGQWQRLSFLRLAAHAAERDVLLLDEPTNHIDPVAEDALYADMARLFAGKLVFVVTHRMSMVSLATRVLVMEAGRIVADGPPAALYRSSALYRELYDTQSRRYREPDGDGGGT